MKKLLMGTLIIMGWLSIAIGQTTVVDTSFTAGDGYADADLAGQSSWVRNTGTGSNAFEVASGAGLATTTTNGFDSATGAAVYWNQLVDNNVNDMISGEIDLRLLATSPADFGGIDLFVFGLSTETTNAVPLSNTNSIMVTVKLASNAKIQVQFSDTTPDSSLLTQMSRAELGWDPKNQDELGVDLETDPLRLIYSIRKTTIAGYYQANVTVSNLTSGLAYTTGDYITKSREGIYDAASAYFTMAHYSEADGEGDTPETSIVNIELDALSVVHSTGNTEVLAGPDNVTAVASDREITLGWDASFEATGYNVYSSDTSGGALLLAGTTAGTTFLDAPLFNNVTNYYKIESIYSTGSALSDEVAAAPTPLVALVNWGGVEDIVVLEAVELNPSMISNNVAELPVGGGERILNIVQDASAASGIGASYIENNPLRILAQVKSQPTYTNSVLDGMLVWAFNNKKIPMSSQIRFDSTSARHIDGSARVLYFIDASDWDVTGAVNVTDGEVSLNAKNTNISGGECRFAIRNAGQWYASSTSWTAASATIPPLQTLTNAMDEAWAPFDAATLASTDLMSASGGSFTTASNASFTAVDAVGVFYEGTGAKQQVRLHQLTLTKVSNLTPYEYWVTQNTFPGGLTAPGDDGDDDGWNNLEEFALYGNPNDPNDAGDTPVMGSAPVVIGGTNGFLYVHTENRNPNAGLIYTVQTSGDLTTIPGSWASGVAVPIGSGNISYYQRAVTNLIPTDATTRFIHLDIQ